MSAFKVTVSFILVVIIAVGNGQQLSVGRCPNFPVKQNFDLQRYLGRWYEYSNYFAIFQSFGDCVTADYTDSTPRLFQGTISGIFGPGKPDDVSKHRIKIGVINRSINSITGGKKDAK